MSRTSRYRQPVTRVHRQVRCRWCGEELEHAATGRPRAYCGASCRVAFNRARRRHSARVVEAALAGDPEPEADYGYPIDMATYVIEEDGTTTRQERCPDCGRMVEAGTDCRHCVAVQIEAGNYAARGRRWEREVLEAS